MAGMELTGECYSWEVDWPTGTSRYHDRWYPERVHNLIRTEAEFVNREPAWPSLIIKRTKFAADVVVYIGTEMSRGLFG